MSYNSHNTATAMTADRSMHPTDLLLPESKSNTRNNSSSSNINNRYYFIITTTATIVVCGTCCLYQFIVWRARKRSRTIVKQIMDSIQKDDGPLIEYNDPVIRDRIITTSLKRASKWMSLSKHDHRIQPMIGQVGGLGLTRKPILTLVPDYLLKPLVLDHRGLREIAFYEAIRTVISQSQPKQEIQYAYNNFLTGREHQQQPQSPTLGLISSATTNNNVSSYRALIANVRNTVSSILTPIVKAIDTIAMAFALTYLQDPYVLESEKRLHEAWQNIQYEMDMIRQLNKFTPPYYGVIVIATPPTSPPEISATPAPTEPAKPVATTPSPSEVLTSVIACEPTQTTVTTIPPIISEPTPVNRAAMMDANNFWKQLEDSHLLLQDLTINYSKPCVMDLKMGVQTYEPDSSPEKRAREYGKYPQQTQFGFRIVGMRFYDPTHADADIKGYRYYEKSYGRSLTTRTELMEAFQLFFSAGCGLPEINNSDGANGVSNSSPSKQSSSPSLLTSSRIRRRTISNTLVQLRPIRRWFEENKSLRFYASSLLLVYEGDVMNSPNPDMTTVKMIDFGRVRREMGGDQGYITGLSTVKNILADLLNDDEQQMNESVIEK